MMLNGIVVAVETDLKGWLPQLMWPREFPQNKGWGSMRSLKGNPSVPQHFSTSAKHQYPYPICGQNFVDYAVLRHTALLVLSG